MSRKLLLVNPINPQFKRAGLKSEGRTPPLALAIIAALTPRDWQVEIIDEHYQSVEYQPADLVGITAFTSTVSRAYEISAMFRERGTPTVLGGIHVSMLPDEAAQHADVVVTGEAEDIWAQVIADFEAGHLQKLYQGGFADLSRAPMPRHDLLNPQYIGAVQTTRGCPMNCGFCSVTAFNGNRYRYRPIEAVLDELEQMPGRFVFILDDNILGHGRANEARALELFKGMIDRKLNKIWVCQASMNLGENEEILRYMAKSGCRFVMMGVEAETPDALKEMNKNLNLGILKKSYTEVFRRIQKHGIAVHGFFIFGLDADTRESIRQRTEFIKTCGVDSNSASILCPLPGTSLYDRMKEEQRLRYTNYPTDWGHYHFLDIVYLPKMGIDTLRNSMIETYGQLFNNKNIALRFLRTLSATHSPTAALISLMFNRRQRHLYLKQL